MIYLSGKITGTSDYMERFATAEAYWKNQEEDVINPAKMCAGLPELSHKQYMELCIVALNWCDTIYMIKGWKNSPGAVIEHDIAVKSEMIRVYEI